MPIAHLLELWKGIEVEPMETEVSGCGVPLYPRDAPGVPQSSKWAVMSILRSLRRAGSQARLGNL